MATSVTHKELAIAFATLNWAAFIGWSLVMYHILYSFATTQCFILPTHTIDSVRRIAFALEGICWVEVIRILIGSLPGNPVLGVVLHLIRLVALVIVIPGAPLSHWTGTAVLLSWAATEIARYPMYLFPSSGTCRSVRLVTPLATFPIGAFSEAYGAYVVLTGEGKKSIWVEAALTAVLVVNVGLGPTLAYPALLKKGLPVLGIGVSRKGGRRHAYSDKKGH